MIAHVRGTLVTKELDRVEVMTAGGVGYELSIPLSVFETLPRTGGEVSLHTHLVVREDGWMLFGFASAHERRVFHRMLDAKGVGPALALSMLSTLTAERLVRAIREKDLATLQSVPRVGRKKAEQLILDLADKMEELLADPAEGAVRPEGAAADDAMRALVSLGYSSGEAERAVRKAVEGGEPPHTASEIIRGALAALGGR